MNGIKNANQGLILLILDQIRESSTLFGVVSFIILNSPSFARVIKVNVLQTFYPPDGELNNK